MSNNLRGADVIHSAAALNTNTATSDYAQVGPATNVVVFINSDTSTTVAIQAATKIDGSVSAGRNTDYSGSVWHNVSGFNAIAVAANVPLCVNISPFAPQVLRVINNTGGTNITTLTVIVEYNG